MKVAIAGYGNEGQSSYQYYVERGDQVTVVSPKLSKDFMPPRDADVRTGPNVYQNLDGFDIVMRTPPLNPNLIQTDGKIWSQANEFLAHCPAPIIGVTGTKGKGTTASLIASILRASGIKVHLLGNIGVAPLSVLKDIEPDDVVVSELSSFQLWDLERSPELAVVVMVEPDHLDVHPGLEDYVSAKANIAAHQHPDDTVIYHPTNELSATVATVSPGHKYRYGVKDDGQAYIENGFFMKNEHVICPISSLHLPGAHNLENACAAISAALAFGAKVDFVEAGLQAFNGLPHRLKFVARIKEVDYYDDSIATTVGSAHAALRAFSGPKWIILGGSDKGADYRDLVATCKELKAKVIAIGATGEAIANLCRELGVEYLRENGDMSAVVRLAMAHAMPGETVILSPASASFDQYKSYSDRGEKFVNAVMEHAE